MDDLIETVAQTIEKANHDWEGEGSWIDPLARAAVAATLDVLAQRAEDYGGTIIWRYETASYQPEDGSLADWLRAQAEVTE